MNTETPLSPTLAAAVRKGSRVPRCRRLRAVARLLRAGARASGRARGLMERAMGRLALLGRARIGTTPTAERTPTPPGEWDPRAPGRSVARPGVPRPSLGPPTTHPRSLARRAALDPRALVLLAAGRASAAPRRGLSLALARRGKRVQTRCTAQQSHSNCCVRDTADERPRVIGGPARSGPRDFDGSGAWLPPIQFVGRFGTLGVTNHMNGHGQGGEARRLLQRRQQRPGGSGAPGSVRARHGTAARAS